MKSAKHARWSEVSSCISDENIGSFDNDMDSVGVETDEPTESTDNHMYLTDVNDVDLCEGRAHVNDSEFSDGESDEDLQSGMYPKINGHNCTNY